jgi:hypothetical protein
MIIGSALFFSGIIISIIWAGSFFNTLLKQSVLLSDISIPAFTSINNTLQINDIGHPLLLQLHFEKDGNSTTSLLSNDTNNKNMITLDNVREIVKDPNGKILSQSNNISKEFTVSIKPTIQGEYILSIHNFGDKPVKIGGLFGPAQFINQNNQVSFNFFNGVIIGAILIVIGILTFIVGIIIAIMDRKKG